MEVCMLPRHIRRTAIIAAAGIILTPAIAQAQFAMCGDRVQIIDQLKTKYKETRQAVGLIANNGAAEL
jgi:hypothetical protein